MARPNINDYEFTGLFCVRCSFSVKSEKDVFDKDKGFYPAFSHQFFGDKWVGCMRDIPSLKLSSLVVEKLPSIKKKEKNDKHK